MRILPMEEGAGADEKMTVLPKHPYVMAVCAPMYSGTNAVKYPTRNSSKIVP